MSLQDIIKKILADIQDEIQAIEAETVEKKKVLDKTYADKERQDKIEFAAKAQAALKSVDEKTASMARRENAKVLQATKRKLLDSVLEQFLASLLAADEEFYTKICRALINKIPFDSGELKVPKEKFELMKRLAPQFKVSATSAFAGGFVALHESSEIDNSFENLVCSEYADELEIYLADQLKLV